VENLKKNTEFSKTNSVNPDILSTYKSLTLLNIPSFMGGKKDLRKLEKDILKNRSLKPSDGRFELFGINSIKHLIGYSSGCGGGEGCCGPGRLRDAEIFDNTCNSYSLLAMELFADGVSTTKASNKSTGKLISTTSTKSTSNTESSTTNLVKPIKPFYMDLDGEGWLIPCPFKIVIAPSRRRQMRILVNSENEGLEWNESGGGGKCCGCGKREDQVFMSDDLKKRWGISSSGPSSSKGD